MADYNYEEGGFMALYFVLTFLTIILIPLTSSCLIPSLSTRAPRNRFTLDLTPRHFAERESSVRCECSQCITKRDTLDLHSLPFRRLGPLLVIFLALC
jgi:preprotein translocase subunit Sec63